MSDEISSDNFESLLLYFFSFFFCMSVFSHHPAGV